MRRLSLRCRACKPALCGDTMDIMTRMAGARLVCCALVPVLPLLQKQLEIRSDRASSLRAFAPASKQIDPMELLAAESFRNHRFGRLRQTTLRRCSRPQSAAKQSHAIDDATPDRSARHHPHADHLADVGDDGDRQQREEVRHRTLGAAVLRTTLSGSAQRASGLARTNLPQPCGYREAAARRAGLCHCRLCDR